jgi:hypothetical protein
MRWLVEVLLEKLARIVPLPDPEGVGVHQVWSLVTVHDVLDVTVKLVDPAGAVTFWFEGLTKRAGVAPNWVTVEVWGVKPVALTVMVAIRTAVDVFSR